MFPGSAAHQRTFLHVATNSIERYWAGPPGSQSVQQLQCEKCPTPLTLSHLSDCEGPVPAVCVEFRVQLREKIAALLESSTHACARDWQLQHSRLTLTGLLQSLFPVPAAASAVERRTHLALAMCGAFSAAQATAAARTLGFQPTADGRSTLHELRLLCLERVEKLFSSQKEAA